MSCSIILAHTAHTLELRVHLVQEGGTYHHWCNAKHETELTPSTHCVERNPYSQLSHRGDSDISELFSCHPWKTPHLSACFSVDGRVQRIHQNHSSSQPAHFAQMVLRQKPFQGQPANFKSGTSPWSHLLFHSLRIAMGTHPLLRNYLAPFLAIVITEVPSPSQTTRGLWNAWRESAQCGQENST